MCYESSTTISTRRCLSFYLGATRIHIHSLFRRFSRAYIVGSHQKAIQAPERIRRRPRNVSFSVSIFMMQVKMLLVRKSKKGVCQRSKNTQHENTVRACDCRCYVQFMADTIVNVTSENGLILSMYFLSHVVPFIIKPFRCFIKT